MKSEAKNRKTPEPEENKVEKEIKEILEKFIREKEEKVEKARREKERKTHRKEQKLELAREIMGIHGDILRLLAYTTGTGTAAFELAHHLRREAPGLLKNFQGLPGALAGLAGQNNKTSRDELEKADGPGIHSIMNGDLDQQFQKMLGKLKKLESKVHDSQ